MIGQHIYSRCLEGYFSKNKMSADTTTVTISTDMFARESDAKMIATECERISALEDLRQVPYQVNGVYRGTLKIRKLNSQISLICRSYRLHSDYGGNNGYNSGESRDFTYSSNYLLTGEDRERFFRQPEYCLNVQDFEPYPSIQQRIEESRMSGRGGRIEANPAYSLFRSECKELPLSLFKSAGFTEELFVGYISSIIERIAYASRRGYEKGKVLVILPKQYNAEWSVAGGNIYAEQVLVATLKILPGFLRSSLNAFVGGMKDPYAAILNGYQLVFMEDGPVREWKQAEHSIIDLERQTMSVSSHLDLSYGQFLWNYLEDARTRENFADSYMELFGREVVESGENYPEKLGYFLRIWKENQNQFADAENRERYVNELIRFSGENWTSCAENLVCSALGQEMQNPVYSKRLEEDMLDLIRQPYCPANLRMQAAKLLACYTAAGNAMPETVNWLADSVKKNDPAVRQAMTEENAKISGQRYESWISRPTLMEFYKKICQDSSISTLNDVKYGTMQIFEQGCRQLILEHNWEQVPVLLQGLGKMLEDPNLSAENKEKICDDLWDTVFTGNPEARTQASDLLRKEEEKLAEDPEMTDLLWNHFKLQFEKSGVVLTDEIIWQLIYFGVIFRDERVRDEWSCQCAAVIEQYAERQPELVYDYAVKQLFSWGKQAGNEAMVNRIRYLMYVYLKLAFTNGSACYKPDMNKMRKIRNVLERGNMELDALEFLYLRYRNEGERRGRFLESELERSEVWEILYYWILSDDKDELLETTIISRFRERKDFVDTMRKYHSSAEDQKKMVQLYFAMMKYEVQELPVSGQLSKWCSFYHDEVESLAEQKEFAPFMNTLKSMLLGEIAALGAGGINELSRGELETLIGMGAANLGPQWNGLNVISEIYSLNARCGMEELDVFKGKILGETEPYLKRAYLNALGSKRQELKGKRSYDDEMIYAVGLLEEQFRQQLEGSSGPVLGMIVKGIFSSSEARNYLITALKLMDMIGRDRNQFQDYDKERVLKECADTIVNIAGQNMESFEDKSILKLYRGLKQGYRNELLNRGLAQALGALPREWREKYDFGTGSSDETSLVGPIIIAALLAVTGIGLNVACFILYNKIGMDVIRFGAIGVAAVGIVGNLIAIALLFTKENPWANALLCGFSLLVIAGTALMGQVYLKQMGRVDNLTTTIESEKAEITAKESEKAELESTVSQLEETIRTAQEQDEKSEIEGRFEASTIPGLKEQVTEFMLGREENWSVYVENMETGEILKYNDHIVRADNMIGLYVLDAGNEVKVNGTGMGTEGFDDRTDEVLLGDEDAVNSLLSQMSFDGGLGKGVATVQEYLDAREMSETSFGETMADDKTSVNDLAKCMKHIYKLHMDGASAISRTETALSNRNKSMLLLGGIPDGSYEMITNQTCGSTYYGEDGTELQVVGDAAIIYGTEETYSYIVCVLVDQVAAGSESAGEVYSAMTELSGIINRAINLNEAASDNSDEAFDAQAEEGTETEIPEGSGDAVVMEN